eukprot:1161928-Pelagomonas_calceolata.AAC.10
MTNVSNAVVWECVKKSNCFLRKGIHGGNHRTMFSAEPGNLYNKHSYKFSGEWCKEGRGSSRHGTKWLAQDQCQGCYASEFHWCCPQCAVASCTKG